MSDLIQTGEISSEDLEAIKEMRKSKITFKDIFAKAKLDESSTKDP